MLPSPCPGTLTHSPYRRLATPGGHGLSNRGAYCPHPECCPERAPVCSGDQRVIAPGHPVAESWMTLRGCRRVLVPLPHPQATSRTLDVLPLLEADFRVQVVFTTPATGFQWGGMERRAHSLGGLWVPWRQAVQDQFDLVLAACDWGIRQLQGPVVLMSHGAGSVRSRLSPWGDSAAHDLHRETLMRGDEVVPAALVLAHDAELAVLAQSCPPALPRAVVAGDPCFDRMLASRPFRKAYRQALDVGGGQKLVVVSTTWSPHALFGNDPGVFARLVAELPGEDYRVVAVLHPFVWLGHGRRQVMAWLAGARAAGLDIMAPEGDWRAAVIGADILVGDHGSVTQYAAALDVPVLMNTRSLLDVRPGSIAAVLAKLAAPLHLDRPLLPQIQRALIGHDAHRYAEVAGLISSQPGRSGAILRPMMYRLLGLPEPTHGLPVSAVPLPAMIP